MRTYETKEELISAITISFQKYINEFEVIPDIDKNKCLGTELKTPYEHLAYQLGWTSLLLDWEARESRGEVVLTPSKSFKWNNLGGLYQQFYQSYDGLTLVELQQQLEQNVQAIIQWIELLSEMELFIPEQRDWATTAAMWPVAKWIHINTVAPFTNFRPKIRKWKKLYLQEKETPIHEN